MIRPILPILAYMSVLSSTYSLHMARDAYIKPPPPPPPAQLLDDLDDMSELLAENGVDLMRPMMGTVHQKTHSGTNGGGGGGSVGGSGSIISSNNGAVSLGTLNHVASNELPELSPPPAHLPSGLRHGPIGPLVGQPPRGLQELFGVQTNFDIRAAQQQLSHGPNGATSTFDVNQSSSSGIDDRDEDIGEGGVGDGRGNGGGDDLNGAAAAGGAAGGQGNVNLQRSASSNKRASPTGGRNKMMADSAQDVGGSSSGLPSIPHGIANQMMLRSTRGQRQYDVPQIECPPAMDGMERFACPTPDRQGRYRCIDDHVLCDGFIDCPEGEDEDRQACMFYKTTKAHLDVLADALLRWARGR
ncbi:zinc finger protein 503 [Anopheles funestus]|uniref:zinc finger protein 503 n=1 Tax=Anopheles funestus TaxID=62324 RepID=UPI0020C695F4|nr:zinc finger protein 503 [Anopheles funestus]